MSVFSTQQQELAVCVVINKHGKTGNSIRQSAKTTFLLGNVMGQILEAGLIERSDMFS